MTRFNSAEKVVLYIGLLLLILSFLSEINFHYIQEFRPGLVDLEIFWRAEAVEAFNSMSFLILGIISIIVSFRLSKKRLKLSSNHKKKSM